MKDESRVAARLRFRTNFAISVRSTTVTLNQEYRHEPIL